MPDPYLSAHVSFGLMSWAISNRAVMREIRLDDGFGLFTAHEDAARRGIHGRILPVGDSCCSDKEKDGTARETAPLLPIDLFKSWIERCTDNHGRKCHPASDTTISGFMLLDIQENKVVKGETVGEIGGYFTLSYVWGNLGQPQLLLENLETLSQVGGLASY